MILDLQRFVEVEQPHWAALEKTLDWLEQNPSNQLSLAEAERFHRLYERAGDDLTRLTGSLSGGELKRYLAGLVSRAYAEIHESRERIAIRPWHWLVVDFPHTFRRHARAFQLSLLLTLVGCAFGGLALQYDPDAKSVLMPFRGLNISPAERVAREERIEGNDLEDRKARFSAQLMTHNIQVSLTTLAMGITFGIGTLLVLFYNGIALGAVAADYILGGQTIFLVGWLLPHGIIEIPAILVGGQAGFVMAHALIGWGDRHSRGERLRAVAGDVVTLAGGTAAMLVWAGIVEAFVSQYHEPVLPYAFKITFGILEGTALVLFLSLSGRRKEEHA